jgi:hypothetical protein
VSRGNIDLGKAVGILVLGVLGIAALNEVATNPKISPLWRKVARTAEGDIFQHVISGEIVTLLA